MTVCALAHENAVAGISNRGADASPAAPSWMIATRTTHLVVDAETAPSDRVAVCCRIHRRCRACPDPHAGEATAGDRSLGASQMRRFGTASFFAPPTQLRP